MIRLAVSCVTDSVTCGLPKLQTSRDIVLTMSLKRLSGRRAYARGSDAEAAACATLVRDGWTVLGQRLRTEAGEIDVVAAKPDMLAIIEVKARPTLADAALALGPRQQARLLAAADIVLAEHPDWARDGMRFDLIVVDAVGTVRRIVDAFRLEN
jgi:putative endonuclease